MEDNSMTTAISKRPQKITDDNIFKPMMIGMGAVIFGMMATQMVTTMGSSSSDIIPAVKGDVVGNWQTEETTLAILGAADTRYKISSAMIDIDQIAAGSTVTVRMYTTINGVNRCIYEQSFVKGITLTGLWIIDGVLGIQNALTISVRSSSVLDNGKVIGFECMMEKSN
jgi:hypothetical protein